VNAHTIALDQYFGGTGLHTRDLGELEAELTAELVGETGRAGLTIPGQRDSHLVLFTATECDPPVGAVGARYPIGIQDDPHARGVGYVSQVRGESVGDVHSGPRAAL